MLRGASPDWAGSGSGSGYGDGYGDGYGSGSGYGAGSGSGYGAASGSGSGYGDGYGYGSASGSGDGYGSGDGSGSGSGSGDGYGSGDYWRATIQGFASKWPRVQQDRLARLQREGATIAFWRSTDTGTAANGGRCDPVEPGVVHHERGPLRNDCGRGQLHATLIPPKWQGDRWWIVALLGEVRGTDEKYWALQREILGECL
jgi:hypothetical protein